ncbi:MAG: hypothetical protein JXA93_03625 [Anaerolineae bacterium]|nr:hypothetical protein [Anaerolineae bacterium]
MLRLETAKLLVCDDQGAFWMVDPELDKWYCNQGGGWIEADPKAADATQPAAGEQRPARSNRQRTWGILIVALALFLIALVLLAFMRWPATLWGSLAPTPTAVQRVQVTIASPSAEGTVASGQEVAVEATLRAEQGLQSVERVDLEVDGQIVESRSVAAAVQSGPSSLPLSLPWRPGAMGDHDLTVVARSAGDDVLGQAMVSIHVAQAPAETLPEPACTADATFLGHVTIPAGSAFQPGARMDKVWQVRNSGTCAWGVGYDLVQTAGESLGTGGLATVPLAGAGDRLNLDVTLWAPMETGTYTSAWQLCTPAGLFFGPTLTVTIEVEEAAAPGEPPGMPGQLRAVLADDGQSVVLTWDDLSDNEDAFRIYRDDVDASIALVPADTTRFVDRAVACGNTYRYRVAAFNAAGPSPSYRTAPVVMPACIVVDTPPAPTEPAESSE